MDIAVPSKCLPTARPTTADQGEPLPRAGSGHRSEGGTTMTWTKGLATTAVLVLSVVAYAPDAGAVTPISACVTITTPGSYILTRNLVAAGDCLVVAADFVTIDLAGHMIRGNRTGIGIQDSGLRKGIAIHDGTITNFLAGLRICGQASIQILVERMR